MLVVKTLKSLLEVEPVKEYRFHPTRRWRLDYAFPEVRLAVELEGGVWTRGAHIRPCGFLEDMEKYNMLAEFGWVLLRYQPKYIGYDQIVRTYRMLEKKNG
jgi:very-short-patch-repair endonuclease